MFAFQSSVIVKAKLNPDPVGMFEVLSRQLIILPCTNLALSFDILRKWAVINEDSPET